MLLGLRVGDPNDEVVGAWLAKESVRDVYLVNNYDDAAVLLDKATAGCRADEVTEIRLLGNTLASWRTEIEFDPAFSSRSSPSNSLEGQVRPGRDRSGPGIARWRNSSNKGTVNAVSPCAGL